jgi:hypothetical protein
LRSFSSMYFRSVSTDIMAIYAYLAKIINPHLATDAIHRLKFR